MSKQIEVVFRNGVFQPLLPISDQFREDQHLTVTIEESKEGNRWLADADPTVKLETVRQALAKVPGTLAQIVNAEREER